MLHLIHAIDRASGYFYNPASSSVTTHPLDAVPPDANTPASHLANTYALFSSAMGPLHGPMSDVKDVQERSIDAREAWDAFEKRACRAEGEAVRKRAAKVETEAATSKESNQNRSESQPKKNTVRIRPIPNRSSEMDLDGDFPS